MFVAGFLGSPPMNFIHDAVVAKNGSGPYIDAGEFQIPLPAAKAAVLSDYVGKQVVFGIRPTDIHDKSMVPNNVEHGAEVRMTVDVIEPLGSDATLFLNSGRQTLVAEVPADTRAREGAPLDVVIDADAAHVFDKDTEKTIL